MGRVFVTTRNPMRTQFTVLACWLLGFHGGVALAASMPGALPDGYTVPSLAPMLDRVTPSIVNIATYATIEMRNPLLEDPYFRRFFNVPDSRRRYRRAQAAGSGVIVDAKNGYIVTNHHVVRRADEISVTLADGRTAHAKLIGVDDKVDLAVLQVDIEDLSAIEFADSADSRVGDFVVAIGNPFGLDQTVTSGIVSALGRSGMGIEGYEDFIQTDASINPGNSGGALVDLHGRLIGINTAIIAPSGGNVGIGFAIPSNMVGAITAQLIEHGEVHRGNVGLNVQGLNVELAQAFGVDRNRGVVVVEVEEESAAERAGLRSGDIITEISGRKINKLVDYHSQMAVVVVDDELQFSYLRDGKVRSSSIKIREELGRLPGERLDPRLAGCILQNFKNDEDRSSAVGTLVTEVERDSNAWNQGLRPGDIIVEVNRRSVGDLREFRQNLKLNSREILLRVYRSGRYGSVWLR